MTIRIIVKSPNLRYEDVVLECGSDWNVAQLKARICETYPTKPKADEQRLIYSGKLLQDGQVLGEFLRDLGENATHTIHLVCKSSMTTADEGQPKSATGADENTDDGGLRFRGTSRDASSTYSPVGVNTDPLTQQYLWWQQAYAQQYWAQYAHYMSANNLTTRQPTGTQPAPVPQAVAVNAPVVPAPQEPDQAAPGVILGPAEEENGGIRAARDWLDWTYIGTRLAILMSFIYFYSSLFRLLLIMLIAAGIYLYQYTVKQRVNRNSPVEVENNVNNENQEQENNPESSVPRVSDPQPNRNTSSFSLALSLITGFFASLIPEVPAAEAAVN